MTAFIHASGILGRQCSHFLFRSAQLSSVFSRRKYRGGKFCAGSITWAGASLRLRWLITHDLSQKIYVSFRPNAIAVKTWPAATNPVRSRPRFGEDSRVHGTDKFLFFRGKHNAHMAQPHYKVASLRCFYSLKITDAVIQDA